MAARINIIIMKTPKPILERRNSIRIDENLPFKIGHQGYDIQATTLNISSHGVMCTVEKDIPIMTQLEVGLSLPGLGKSSKGKVFQTRGVVVRKEKDPASGHYFIAIFFSEMKPKAREILYEFIENRLKRNTRQ